MHTRLFINCNQSRNALLWTGIFLFSVILGKAIVSEKFLIVLAFAAIPIYLSLSIHIKILLLALGALFPLSFGALGPIANFYWFEWMAPILALIMFIDLSLFRKKRLLVKGNFWLYSSFLALIITAVVNYARNPVLAQQAMGVVEQEGGIRSYYDLAVGICLSFVFLWYLSYYLKDIKDIRKFLIIVATFSISIGLLQLAAFFFDFQLPFLYSNFRFDHKIFDTGIYSGLALRIGGLSECAVIGLSAILGLTYRKWFGGKEIASLCLCAVLLILSGGRTHAGGALLAITVFAGLSGAKRRIFYSACLMSLTFLFWLFATSGLLGGQLERYATIGKGYEAIDKARDTTYELMLDTIKKQPIFGKGIGYAGSGSSNTTNFAFHQLKTGGHGGYLSILSIFGLLGLYFLITSLVYGFARGFTLAKQSINCGSSLAMFCLLLLIISAVSYFTGGNGYSDMRLYLCIGIIAGLSRKGIFGSYNEY